MAAEYLRLVWKTTRFAIEPEGFIERAKKDLPVIVGFWHGQHFLMPYLRTHARAQDQIKVLVSRHRDGEINAIAAEHLNVGTIRGSGAHGGIETTRKGGASAFRHMLAALAEGVTMALTADIPKISRVAGLGIVRLAAMSGRPIYLVAITTRNRITLNNWDHTEINLPFGRGALVGRGPFWIAPDADDGALETARRMVESELEAATVQAHALVQGAGQGTQRGHARV